MPGEQPHDDGDRSALPPAGAALTRRGVLQSVGLVGVFGGAATEVAARSDDESPGSLATTLSDADNPRFGAAVALDGSTAVVGTPPDTSLEGLAADGHTRGRVSVFALRDGTWIPDGTLRPRRVTPGGDFGAAVAVDGHTVVVGAPLPAAGSASHAGSATVFARRDGSWVTAATMDGGDPSTVDRFGTAVAVDDDTIVVGAPVDVTDRGARTGSATVSVRTNESWTQEATLTPPPGVDRFGRSVGLTGDVIAVGARLADGRPKDPGIVMVYERSRLGWREIGRHAPVGDGRDDGFGAELSTDGETLLVGAPTERTEQGSNTGTAYAYERSGTGWRLASTLRGPDGAGGGRFGTAVSVDDGTAVVGSALGHGPRVFTRSDGKWIPRRTLTPESRGTGVGDVAVDGSRALVGVGTGTAATDERDRGLEVFEP
jgi:hypothetical protein